jgi:hydrogenase maturation protein HypF
MKTPSLQRLRGVVHGMVQGVGFRPFVYRQATKLGLHGWVQNSTEGLFFEAEGDREALQRFAHNLETDKPPRAVIQDLELSYLDPLGYDHFEIRRSAEGGARTALILPDIATCADCLREIFDPNNRRYRYPFNSCTNCGPRFSIIEALPYDRPNTSMKGFTMCPECHREYHDPLDRRFDAQPIACPVCGPQLQFLENAFASSQDPAAPRAAIKIPTRDDALKTAAEWLRSGRIIALKGLGGFQLLADARREEVVSELRQRKRREAKPFAVMYPSLVMARDDCVISELEEKLLLSPEAPIVLLRQKRTPAVANSVAPGNPNLGVMLPYTPLHHLLMAELAFPIVATSGNLTDEPICTDNFEAFRRLREIADGFLVHDRPIVRHVDDSVVCVTCDREMILRRARGYAPAPIHLPAALPTTLAVGSHLKNTVALSVGSEVFLSQHLGDLSSAEAHAAFQKSVADLPRLYDARPTSVVCDLHPEYLSTKYATGLSIPVHHVQHHWAHVLSCLADNGLEPPVLGVAWDGTGYGTDGTIWGSEFLASNADLNSFERVAHLRPFRLPGGDAATKQPYRSALGLLFEMHGHDLLEHLHLPPLREYPAAHLPPLLTMMEKGVNSPWTSSMGRLFDAVASLIGLRQKVNFEGQAAMDLEYAVEPEIEEAYPFSCQHGPPYVLDWQPMIEQIIVEFTQDVPPGVIAGKFHNTLAAMVVAVARKQHFPRVLLTGGCFQNRTLLELCVHRLSAEGFEPYWHRRVPPNDGGIALGQIIAAQSQSSH